MLFVEMPAKILRYSARAVGTVPMGRGVFTPFRDPRDFARLFNTIRLVRWFKKLIFPVA